MLYSITFPTCPNLFENKEIIIMTIIIIIKLQNYEVLIDFSDKLDQTRLS